MENNLNPVSSIEPLPAGEPPVHPQLEAQPLPVYPQAVRIPKYELKPHDSILAWLCLPLGIFLVRGIICRTDGFQATAFFLLLFTLGEVYVRRCGCKPGRAHALLGGLICLFSAVFSLTANALIHGLCFLLLVCLHIWRIHAVCGKTGIVTRFFAADLHDSAVRSPLRHMDAAPSALTECFRKTGKGAVLRSVLTGLLVTVPLTVLVAVLLARADSGMERMMQSVKGLFTDDARVLIIQAVCGVIAGFWLFGGFIGGAMRADAEPLPDDSIHAARLSKFRVIPNAGLYAGVTPICMLYLIYVISQTGYFLSAFAGKLPKGLLYSEYARRGFFELCAIAVINLVVILVLTGCAKERQQDGRRCRLLTGYAVVFCGVTLFIIATAFAKMLLYIHACGLTRLRIYTAWFMLLLTVVFLVLLIRQFTEKLPAAKVLAASFVLLFGLLCFSRPDALIAQSNLQRYASGSLADPDVNMLCRLSDDAYTVMAEHRDILAQCNMLDYFEINAARRIRSYDEDASGGWNLSSMRLRAVMQS